MVKPITTHIDISAPPGVVRAKLLDFSALSIYKPPFINSITLHPATKDGLTLVPGDRMSCVFDGRKLEATVAENSAAKLEWTGTVLPGLHGRHTFRFEEVSIYGGEGGGGGGGGGGEGKQGTRVYHEEALHGWLSFIMSDENVVGRGLGERRKLREAYEGFNGAFKRWVEEGR